MTDDPFDFDVEILFCRRYSGLSTLTIREKLKVRIDVPFDAARHGMYHVGSNHGISSV